MRSSPIDPDDLPPIGSRAPKSVIRGSAVVGRKGMTKLAIYAAQLVEANPSLKVEFRTVAAADMDEPTLLMLVNDMREQIGLKPMETSGDERQ